MVHVCSKIKCSCGCEYCSLCYNGCPQCGAGKMEIITTATTTPITYYNITKK